MDYLTASIISGVIYDGIKIGVTISSNFLKIKLRNWLIDDDTAIKLEEGISDLNITEEHSELAIEKKILAHEKLNEVIKKIQKTNTINQKNKYGDNIIANEKSTIKIKNK